MADTYETAAEAEADRAQQKALLAALGGWERALRRDKCGAWRITGKHGSIHAWGDGITWVLYVSCHSGQHGHGPKSGSAFATSLRMEMRRAVSGCIGCPRPTRRKSFERCWVSVNGQNLPQMNWSAAEPWGKG